MGRSNILLAFIVCALCVSPALSRGPRGFNAWFVDSLVKVFPHDAARTHRLSAPDFSAARNQHVNIQVAIRSGAAVPGITATLVPLKDGDGHTIDSVTIRQEGYVVVGSHTHAPADELIGTAPGWYPDVLLPLPLDLKANWTQSLWVEIHVPSDAAPGVYHGAVEIRSGDMRQLARLPFRFHVFPAVVPQTRSVSVTNWFSLDDKTSRQFFGVPMFSGGWWKLVGNVAHVFAAHRQNVVLTPLMTLIHAKAVGGRIEYDYSDFDRWAETFRNAGVIGTIEGSHLTTRAQGSYNGALEVPIVEIVNNQVRQVTLPAGDPRVSPFLTSFLSQLYAHLEQRHWAGFYVQHISDEPHGPEIPYYGEFAAIVHRVMPGIKTIDAVSVANMNETLEKSCDIWVPILGSFDHHIGMLNNRIHSGHPVWYYTCLYPNGRYPNRFIDFPMVKVRLLPWLDFRYGLTGFLHWGGNDWTPKPMLDTQPVINANETLLPPGDAFIYYPDRKRLTFDSSIRMETFLAGIEDYELLKELSARNRPEANRLAQSAISSFTSYVREPGPFRNIEIQLLEALSKP